MSRSYEPITNNDLKILVELARKDRTDLFVRKPDTGRLYSKRLFAVALCQGGALHYLDGKNGVKDLDVWSFYTENPESPFPYQDGVSQISVFPSSKHRGVKATHLTE